MLKLLSTKNTAHVDFTDENLDKFSVVSVINITAVREPLTPKLYADNVIDETTKEINYKKFNFMSHSLVNTSHIAINSQPTDGNHAVNEAYVAS